MRGSTSGTYCADGSASGKGLSALFYRYDKCLTCVGSYAEAVVGTQTNNPHHAATAVGQHQLSLPGR